MLLNPDGLIFVGQRIDSVDSAWQMPQGGIDETELPIDAAIRELKEETGTSKIKVIAELSEWLSYELPHSLAKKLWDGRYLGQKQKWFAMRFLGDDSDIDINTKNPEFKAWKWIEAKHLADIAVPFKRQIYAKLAKDLAPKAVKANKQADD